MSHMKNGGGWLVVAALAVLSMPLAGHAAISKTEPGISQTAPSVIALNQKLRNDQVTVTYAYLPADGFLAIYGSDKNGHLGDKPLGRIELKAGDHRNVAVKLDSAPATGSALWVSLSGENQESYWPKALPLQNKFKVE